MAARRAVAAGSARAAKSYRGTRPISPSSSALEMGAAAACTYPDGKPLPNDDMPASLLLPMGRTGPAFLAYAEFRAPTPSGTTR